ncbi:basic leucine zipper transcriptional factor ATF-like 3 isoform X2 [Larimichthys crocea]|uniref:basic leucine zipper transcriptional factor ATF-like 3 isoform X2 n=1 Tax=Larimichthys crocea TaxID=215358 RepID=UPI000F5E58E0|nr:basic leucine zipper transcriptional factor ATF-like 3 isoform X2 [Larimichthys crocea]
MLLGEEMSPLFMDTGYEPNSPSSLSAEESHSNTAGSEREGEGQQTEKRGTKRQEKNRDAARKSRKKQTERADELHEKHRCQKNSACCQQFMVSSRVRVCDWQLHSRAPLTVML